MRRRPRNSRCAEWGPMKRLGLILGVALPLLMAALGSVVQSDRASAAATRPSPPTAATATSVAGVGGVSVSWSTPISDGGSPILYYLASTYSGAHWCLAPNPGPDSCHIAGITNGSIPHAIRIHAVNANGPGQAAALTSVVTPGSSATGGAPSSAPPATNPPATSQPTSPASGSAGAASLAAAPGTSSGTGDTSSSGRPTQLPFTGINLASMLVLGLSLLLLGLDILRPFRRRRRVLHQIAGLGPVAAVGGRVSGVSRWFFGL